jgi:hypothetical protein
VRRKVQILYLKMQNSAHRIFELQNSVCRILPQPQMCVCGHIITPLESLTLLDKLSKEYLKLSALQTAEKCLISSWSLFGCLPCLLAERARFVADELVGLAVVYNGYATSIACHNRGRRRWEHSLFTFIMDLKQSLFFLRRLRTSKHCG